MDCVLLDSCIFLFYLTFSSNQIASLGIPLIDITEDFFFLKNSHYRPAVSPTRLERTLQASSPAPLSSSEFISGVIIS